MYVHLVIDRKIHSIAPALFCFPMLSEADDSRLHGGEVARSPTGPPPPLPLPLPPPPPRGGGGSTPTARAPGRHGRHQFRGAGPETAARDTGQ